MTLASIIATSNRVPGAYIRVSFGVGVRASGDGTRWIVLFGNKTSAGSMALATEVDCFSEDDARAHAGAGGELFWMYKAAIAAWPGASVKLIAVAESAGAAATGTLVWATTATGAGTGYVTVLGQEIEFPINAGDDATAIGAACALAINAKGDWPVTAANATGTVTVTARNKGPRGNFLAVRGRITSGIGTTVTPPATGYLTGGTTSDDPQAALDVIAAVQRRYLVAPYSDATQLGKFKTHVQAEDEPEVGHRKRLVFGSLDTLANATTLATAINEPRAQCIWQEKADLPPALLAAGAAARIAARESTKVSYNLIGEVIPGLKPHYAVGDRPIPSELQSALSNGITPLQSADDGTVFLVHSITTKSRDSLGNADYRVFATAKVAVPDEGADRIELAFRDRFASFNASQDPPDGDAPPPEVVVPSMCRDLEYEILSAMEGEGHLDVGSVERNKDQILNELSAVSPGRFNGVVPIDVIEWASQFALDIRQIG